MHDKECYTCGKKGHIAPVCPVKGNDKENYQAANDEKKTQIEMLRRRRNKIGMKKNNLSRIAKVAKTIQMRMNFHCLVYTLSAVRLIQQDSIFKK